MYAPKSRFSSRRTKLLITMAMPLWLVACDGDNSGSVPQVVITPSTTEGTAPLDVTFDVAGTNIVVGASWDFGDGESAVTGGGSSVSHTFVDPGEYVVTVEATTNRVSLGTQTVTIVITVLAGEGAPAPGGGSSSSETDVNLRIASFAIDNEVTPGAYETISAIIQNAGTEALIGAGFLHVGYYLSTDQTITVDDILLGDTSIAIGDSFAASDIPFGAQTLAPEQNYQYDHPLAVTANIPGGTYYAGAIVDYIDEYHWYTFPRATDTEEFEFPDHVVVEESDETDNTRLLTAHQVTVNAPACVDDAFEPDNSPANARSISVGQAQARNFCHDNSDWLRFNAVAGNVYKITTSMLGLEADTQLILYDRDEESILLFNDNILNEPWLSPCGLLYTADLECTWPPNPPSEIVWEAQVTGTYFIKVRLTTCDEDEDLFCASSPDGVGLDTEYTISLQ